MKNKQRPSPLGGTGRGLPLVGRFLSPDNYVQLPDFTQNFNRYSYALNNPLKYTDPDGENPLFAAMFIGGFFNFIFQGLTGHINSFGDALKAFGIGALSGLAGFGAGQAVTGALSTATTLGGAIANGAAIGAASGFAGGFVGGAGNAWAGGASFGQGLGIGLKAGGLGALAGGVIGGGINGARFLNVRNSWYKTYNISDDGIEMNGKRLLYSNKNANIFDEKYFGKDPGLRHLYADGSVPHQGMTGAGATEHIGNTRYSNIYLKESAFKNKFKLFMVLGHEHVHVAQFYSGLKGFTGMAEYGAYSWNKWVYDLLDKPFPYTNVMNNALKQAVSEVGYSRIEDFMWYNLKTFKWNLIP